MSEQQVSEPIQVQESQEQVIATEAGAPPQPPPPPPSKNALKKAAKQERFQALKLERRAREKEARKEKKRLKAEKRAAGELDEEDDDQNRRAKRRKIQFGGRVVVDLGFDDLMNDKEVKSLCSQLAYTYSANRQADFPFSLVFTSLNGQTHQRLESLSEASYKRWANSEWWTDGFEQLWVNAGSSSTSNSGPADRDLQTGPSDTPGEGMVEKVEDHTGARSKVVYLTADCEEELTELKPDETYIIGGICDHNRYKNLCLNKAVKHGVRTAKLPIGRYLSNLPTRKVLTVNQCFEILLKWVETKDWEEALYSVIPKRKFQTGEKGSKATSGEAGDKPVEGEGEDDKGNEVTVVPEPSYGAEIQSDGGESS